jgi:hypothetical protein
MKNHILFSFLGAVILFIWSFLSWAAINLHQDEQTYTPLEKDVLSAIAETGLEQGMYALGQGDPTGGQEAQWAEWESDFKGKPWGVLNYQSNMEMSMGMNMFRGFTKDLLIAALVFMLLSMIKEVSYKKAVIMCLSIGLIAFMTEYYNGYIWFKTPGIYAHLLDAVVPWTLLGLLGGKLAVK